MNPKDAFTVRTGMEDYARAYLATDCEAKKLAAVKGVQGYLDASPLAKGMTETVKLMLWSFTLKRLRG